MSLLVHFLQVLLYSWTVNLVRHHIGVGFGSTLVLPVPPAGAIATRRNVNIVLAIWHNIHLSRIRFETMSFEAAED